MNKIVKKILYVIAFLIIGFLFIYLGKYDYHHNDEADNVIVAKKFSYINENNKFEIINIDQTLSLLEKNAVILFAYPESEWADYYASIVNNAALETTINKIYLFNVKEDRSMKNKKYEKLLNKLNNFIIIDDEFNEHLFVPSLVVVKDGKIIYFDNETAEVYKNMTVKKYWNENNAIAKKEVFKEKINMLLEELTND